MALRSELVGVRRRSVPLLRLLELWHSARLDSNRTHVQEAIQEMTKTILVTGSFPSLSTSLLTIPYHFLPHSLPFLSPPPRRATGASGFLASYIISDLLSHNYTVHGTIRSLSKSEEILSRYPDQKDRLKLFQVKDLVTGEGLEEAMKGCHAVLHTASPCELSSNLGL